ncbi:hypothetical protein B0T14DRAFT_563721 [Immersiella caudata]|uniref:Cytochrome P450 n=1 Tax=Immersiella caudata TaxID=314043 RepID=A0AA39X619_9PEZI|nr:hypothetical protein B0T14DRAFT_563721 [Immersiella caudata]
MASTILITILTLLIAFTTYLFKRLFPVPLPAIPHDVASVHRPFGEAPRVKSLGQRTHETSAAVVAQCRKLSSPLVQFLITSLPGTAPVLILDNPREVEDILLRRNKEFDQSTLTTQLFSKILPNATLAQLTTPQLKAQKRL